MRKPGMRSAPPTDKAITAKGSASTMPPAEARNLLPFYTFSPVSSIHWVLHA
jgi:hypothetical protein